MQQQQKSKLFLRRYLAKCYIWHSSFTQFLNQIGSFGHTNDAGLAWLAGIVFFPLKIQLYWKFSFIEYAIQPRRGKWILNKLRMTQKMESSDPLFHDGPHAWSPSPNKAHWSRRQAQQRIVCQHIDFRAQLSWDSLMRDALFSLVSWTWKGDTCFLTLGEVGPKGKTPFPETDELLGGKNHLPFLHN